MKKRNYYYGLLRASFTAAILFLFVLPSLAQDKESQQIFYGEKASEIVPGAKYVKEGKGTPIPARVKFDEQGYLPIEDFFVWLREAYAISPDIEFVAKRNRDNDNGNAHHRYTITYQNVEVDLNWMMVHTKKDLVYGFNGYLKFPQEFNIQPTINEDGALPLALEEIDARQYLWQIPQEEAFIKRHREDENATYFPKGTLVIVEDQTSKEYVLAWRFDVYTTNPDKDAQIFINAKTGEKIKSYPLSYQCDVGTVASTWYGTQNINTDINGDGDYILLDDCGGANIRTTQTDGSDFTASDNNWTSAGETGPGTTHLHGRISMDYLSSVHSRDSYDDADGNLEIRYISESNAYWSGGGLMRIGNSNSANDDNHYNTLDVVAHEMFHGVTDFEANLVYQGEPGALNESFSDIFGETCEMWYENLPSNQWDWLHREDYFNGINRSLINPKAANDPDTYNGTNWANTCNGCGDAGGVHTNSGVQNHWFYLLTVGGSGTNDNNDDYTVTGIGLTKARTIAYDNLTDQLGVNSDYSDARDGAIAAAEDAYGACSNEVRQVKNAWYAVGVGDPAVFVEISSSSDISCYGADDGSIDISVVGTSPFSYEWSDGPTSKNRTGLSPGVYTVTVTDATGCTSSVGTLISEPNELDATITNESNYNGYNISCYGGSNGEATVTGSGGTLPYTYQWSDGQSLATASNLSAGNYSVKITDANGCTDSDNITITEPPVLTASIPNVSNYNGYNISCNGGSDGWATAEGGGGVPGYTYQWSDGQNTATATNLSAGYYEVTVTDLNGCTETSDITLTEPDPLTIEAGDNQTVYYGYPPAECATISWSGAGGGVPPYTISWNDGMAQAHDVCPMTTTTYTVTISDANGCVETDEVMICAIDVRCGKNLNKVEICHVPEGDPLNTQTICVGLNAVASHLAHGDMLAACGTDHSCPPAMAKTDLFRSSDNSGYLSAYPNPFSESTTIAFSPSSNGEVSLQLFDNLGRLVKELYNGDAEYGMEYQFTLDGATLSSGVHICVLRLDDGTQITKKLIFER